MQIVTSKGAAAVTSRLWCVYPPPGDCGAGDTLANKGRRVVTWLPPLTGGSVSGL